MWHLFQGEKRYAVTLMISYQSLSWISTANELFTSYTSVITQDGLLLFLNPLLINSKSIWCPFYIVNSYLVINVQTQHITGNLNLNSFIWHFVKTQVHIIWHFTFFVFMHSHKYQQKSTLAGNIINVINNDISRDQTEINRVTIMKCFVLMTVTHCLILSLHAESQNDCFLRQVLSFFVLTYWCIMGDLSSLP